MSSKPIKDAIALRATGPSPTTVSTEEEAQAIGLVTKSLPALIERERSRRDENLRSAARVLRSIENRGGSVADDLKDDHLRNRYQQYLSWAEQQDAHALRFDRILEERRKVATVTVLAEPRVYGPTSPNSYYLDLCRSVQPQSRDHDAAVERLSRYRKEVAVEANLGSTEGQRALRSAGTMGRGESPERLRKETRALTTASAAGGAFVTPQYLTQDFAEWRSYPPSFLQQTARVPDLGYGVEFFIPSVSASVNVSQQVEGDAVGNSSPTGAYLSSSLVVLAGEVDVSQQLYDQAGPTTIDVVLHRQLDDALQTSLDTAALNTAMATAGSVTAASVFSANGFWNDAANATQAVQTTQGTALPSTHAFFGPQLFSYLTCQTDTNGQPLFRTQPAKVMAPISMNVDGTSPVGWTGENLLGSTAVFTDANLPASGSNARWLVCNASNVFTLTSEPVLRAVPETLADDLSVVIQYYAYFGAIVRHQPCVQVVSGGAYPFSPTFAA